MLDRADRKNKKSKKTAFLKKVHFFAKTKKSAKSQQIMVTTAYRLHSCQKTVCGGILSRR
jgi:hypothetical protein